MARELKSIRLEIKLPAELYAAVEAAAEREGINMSQMVRRLLANDVGMPGLANMRLGRPPLN